MKTAGAFVVWCALCTCAAASAALPARSSGSFGPERVPKAVSPAFQADARHDGFVEDAKLEPPLKAKWTLSFGSSVSYPIVADGVVVAASGATLFAAKASDGTVLWTAQAPSGTQAWIGVAYDAGHVFAQAEYAFSYEPSLFAFEAKSGKQTWSASLPGQYAFSAPPVVANGLVYTSGAGSGGTVYAFDEKIGGLIWTNEVENGDDSSPVATGTDVYVSYACPQTYDFNALSGKQVWHYNGPCEGGGGATAVLNGGLLFVEDSFVYTNQNGLILNAANGAVAGSFNSPYIPAFADGLEYLVESGPSGESLVALNPTTQASTWSVALSGGASFLTPPFVVNNVVYETLSTGALAAYAAASGDLVASYPLPAGTAQSEGLAAGDNRLIVPDGGVLYAFAKK
jgi:outer membrane protein assembly factor BamB